MLNGASYDQHFLDATRPSTLARADSSNPDSIEALNNDLDECALLTNKRNKPLLVSLTGAKSNNDDGKLVIQAVVSMTPYREGQRSGSPSMKLRGSEVLSQSCGS